MSPKPADSLPALPPGSSGELDKQLRIDRLVRELLAGNDPETNFRTLYESFHRPLQRFFARKGCSPDECLDLTQETFLGIHRGLRSYHHDGRFESWMYRIATTTYLKRLRARSTGKRQGFEVPLEELGSHAKAETLGEPLSSFLAEERRQSIRQAVTDLPEQMRKCLTLRLYHDLSYREIAVVMKLKIDTVKAHLFQARRRLRDTLGESSFDLDL